MDEKYTGFRLNENYNNTQKFVFQSNIKFVDLMGRLKFGYRINPIENPYYADLWEKQEEQYQRRIDKNRVKEIKEFIRNKISLNKENANPRVIFPTAILLAFDYDDDIVIQDNNFDFYLPDIIHIVDGQHRLWSMQELYKEEEEKSYVDEESHYIVSYLDNYFFNCTILMNFDMWEQAQIFADVNFKQKSVNKSLYYDIYGIVYGNNNDSKRNAMYVAHKIIEDLNSKKESALYHYVKMLGEGKGFVSQSCLADAIIPSIISPLGVWYIDFDAYHGDIPKYGFITVEVMTFFNVVAEKFNDLWPKLGERSHSILCKTTGIQALVKLIGYIHLKNKKEIENMIPESTDEIIENTVYKSFISEKLDKLYEHRYRLFATEEKVGDYSGTGGKGLATKLYREMTNLIEGYNVW